MLRSLTCLLAAAVAALVLAPAAPAAPSGAPATVASFDTPWEILPLAADRVLVTERGGRVRRLDGTVVYQRASTRFLGLAADPGYAANRLLYLYERRTDQSVVTRLRDPGGAGPLVEDGVVVAGIPTGDPLSHDGGRIAFGPDGRLYVTTGDQHQPSRPQDLDSLNGKILRVGGDGTAPADNPFNDGDGVLEARDLVWSYGHRHPQGLAWDAQGRLWETEHGPTNEGHAPVGAENGRDELNLIARGCNYGWPDVAGDQRKAGTIPPVVHSGAAAPGAPAWAPGDLAFSPADGLLYAPALAGAHLHVFEPDGLGGITRHGRLYQDDFGRLRVAVPDGAALWFTGDGNGAAVRRVMLAPGFPAAPALTQEEAGGPAPVQAPCATAPTPRTDGGTPGTGSAPAGDPVATPPSITPPTPRAGALTPQAAVERALTRAVRSVRTQGLRGLRRRGAFTAPAGGLLGRTTFRVTLRRSGGRAVTIATGTVRARTRRTVTLRARLTPSGRRLLRRVRRGRAAVVLTHTPDGYGAKVRRSGALTLTR